MRNNVFSEKFVRLMIFCAVIFVGMMLPAAEELLKVKEMTPGYTGKFIWGMFTEKRRLKDILPLKADLPQYPDDHKVEIIRYITCGGIGEKEGLQPGDVILEMSAYSSVTNRPGDKIRAKVWRKASGKASEIELTAPQYYQVKYTPYQKAAGADEFEKTLPPDWETYADFLRKEPVRSNLDDLRQRLTDIDSLTDAYRLPVFRYLIRNPFRLEQVSRSWSSKIAAAEKLHELLLLSKYMLDFSPAEHTGVLKTYPRPGKDAAAEEIFEYYVQILQQCEELHKAAWARITQEERGFVRKYRHEAFESICKYHMLSYEPDTAVTRRTLKIFEILNRIEQNALFAQAQTAALLFDEQLISRLKQIYGNRQGILFNKNTPYGEIVIAGSGDDYHRRDAALIIDLGGDDIYLNNQASPVAGNINTAVIIDVSGNDCYSSTDSSGQGCGDLGVGMLLDLAGDDTYTGIEMVQGSAFGGIGILYDRDGNDSYRAIRMSQAAAFFGAGWLIDQAGNDNYTVQHFGQALGSVRGTGILKDNSGDDLYICKGIQQTSYNTRGHFDGWGQGIGFGVRPFASGGIGILLDNSGSDRYDGGTFTQGGGYYYSYGICSDRGVANDFYSGTRYSNGFAAHQALGAFIEHGGNDVYRTLHCVSLGISWDETVVLFADDQGDDIYHSGTGGISYSAAHQNGICFFFDRGGNDRYNGMPPLPASRNTYHLGTSLAIFMDSGSGDDHYLKRQNNTVSVEPGDDIFIDR
ncbi:MAG: hypothetical protein E7057_08160 [Lentisphaerae bacterium]|nr:hypothetical protein [Lentisphaerota bacterium]